MKQYPEELKESIIARMLAPNNASVPHQISIWQENCRQAHAPQTSKADKATIRTQKNSIKSLKTDLRRKEKALAEAAALLILQKKVHDFWEAPKGGKPTKLSVVR